MSSSDLPLPDRHAGSDVQHATLTIDVFFDFICPWCWIGSRHLKHALSTFTARHPDVKPNVRWHAYRLLPEIPAEGVPYQPFYVRRLGSAEAVSARRAQVRHAGLAAGVAFNFERIGVMPNTQRAHSLIDKYRRPDSGEALAQRIERVFQAYFVEGADIGNEDVLRHLEAEFDSAQGPAIAACAPAAAEPEPGQIAISGVPYFVFNAAFAVSGAHPPESLLQAMEHAMQASASPSP
ncbi:DsbA family oxidoreductase [Ralstonia soli]|uniref:DsbA family oxidoreductase n=1 Tax=Ralstonia soli TaxID=2953896 RepID=A0ABT1AMA8_9RALS|nr:DsbA family oxidoreductase [Ralstonia soli]MCO5399546.1 DsbA family oxidoreductase [Ralstonia soli]